MVFIDILKAFLYIKGSLYIKAPLYIKIITINVNIKKYKILISGFCVVGLRPPFPPPQPNPQAQPKPQVHPRPKIAILGVS